MINSTGIIGVKANGKVEFNPQKDLLGKIDGFPVISNQLRQGKDMRRRLLSAI